MSKFGKLVERLVGAQAYFVPDGANFGSVETPDLSSVTNKPSGSEWTPFDLGRVNKSVYTPKTKDRMREFAVPGGGYKEQTKTVVVQDIFKVTLIDYAEKLYDQMQFGMATEPVSGTAQQAFKTPYRHKDGWVRMVRIDEEGNAFCELEIWARVTIDEAPDDQNEPGSPVLRIAHLAEGGVLDIVELTYPA